MKAVLISGLVLAVLAVGARSQAPDAQADSPREVVEQLWSMAATGELMTPAGWRAASRIFASPGLAPPTRTIRVVSNHYGVGRPSIRGNTAELVVWYYGDVGQIDPALRFTPAAPPTSSKTPYPYRLVLAPSRWTEFGPDGKTVLKQGSGPALEWQIDSPQPPPWTTVNAAIRYVLEQRKKTTDPAVKANADKTIASLLRYP